MKMYSYLHYVINFLLEQKFISFLMERDDHFIDTMSTTIIKSQSPIISTKVELNNGVQMPIMGMGTYLMTDYETMFKSIDAGLAAGYRLIDTATDYDNEELIGKVLKKLLPKFDLSREDIFITSKLSPVDLHKDRVEQAVKNSCKKLDVPYIDLYLIHWPGAGDLSKSSTENAKRRMQTWEILVKMYRHGLLHSIGVSNYTIDHLKPLLQKNYGVKPCVNQIEVHPYNKQRPLLAYCKENDICVQAYCSLGGTNSGQYSVMKDPKVEGVAKKLNRSPAQILLRWALQNNVLVIPKSVTPERIHSNVEVDFEIPKAEMDTLNGITREFKYGYDPAKVV